MRFFYSTLLLASMLGGPSPGQELATLTVRVAGLTSTKGQLHYALYAAGDEFPGRRTARHRDEIGIERIDFSFTITGIVPGTYALVLAHDEDGDGEIAAPRLTNPFAGEPVGVSNYQGRLFAPPNFDRARFEIRAGSQDILVTLFPTALF